MLGERSRDSERHFQRECVTCMMVGDIDLIDLIEIDRRPEAPSGTYGGALRMCDVANPGSARDHLRSAAHVQEHQQVFCNRV